MEIETTDDIMKCWYALRVTYNRELKVKKELDRLEIENFVPMQYKVILLDERKVKRLVPSVHNLIFVRMGAAEMKEFKLQSDLPIRYIMNRETNHPIVVPDNQMRDFIAISGTYDEQLLYMNPDELCAKKGDKVKITGGIFNGCVGTLMRIRGDRRVVVSIPGIVAVATAFVHPSLLQKVSE